MLTYTATPVECLSDIEEHPRKLSRDRQQRNDARASFAARALMLYGSISSDSAEYDSADSMVMDLLVDLRHLCDALNVDFDEQVDSSRINYAAEIQGED